MGCGKDQVIRLMELRHEKNMYNDNENPFLSKKNIKT